MAAPPTSLVGGLHEDAQTASPAAPTASARDPAATRGGGPWPPAHPDRAQRLRSGPRRRLQILPYQQLRVPPPPPEPLSCRQERRQTSSAPPRRAHHRSHHLRRHPQEAPPPREGGSSGRAHLTPCRGIVESSLGRGAIELGRERGFGEVGDSGLRKDTSLPSFGSHDGGVILRAAINHHGPPGMLASLTSCEGTRSA